MLRRHPDGWSVWRQALFALVPVVLGAAVMLAGDGPAPAPTGSKIEATGPAPAPAPVANGAEAAAEVAPIALGGTTAPPATEAVAPAPGATDTAVLSGAPAVTPAPTASAGPAPAAPASPASTTQTTATPAPAPSSTTVPPTTMTLPAPAPAPPPAPTGRAPDPSAAADVVPLTNADRTANGLSALSRNACLDSVASGFAEQMAKSGVLAHNAGAGAGVQGCRVDATWGDNVGRASPCDIALLERDWMASPGHRRNILTAGFTRIGVGAWTGDDGTCWVQVLFSS